MNAHEESTRLDPILPPRAAAARSARRATQRPISDSAISGTVAVLLALLAAVFARTAVIDGTPFFHPLATLAFIGACTAFIGGRIRTLTVLEEELIASGHGETEARKKAEETLARITERGVDRR